ncbi:TonB-dependent receptor [Sphingorhabdus sp. EL138]|uniref:TonB-dependent receptor n=1 Tax=Sphingorhabdus sp. EL138 TaxID=2073156 RepID=UPI0025D27445|nr:TonB-dependent receptor [Sphingorhabdus sp. EL138]
MKLGNHLLKAAMLSTISIASLSAGSAAFAQDNAPQASDDVDEEVIIVTATKREQTLQEVPISVSVTSGEAIARSQVRDLIDLQTLVPSLRVSQLQTSANTNFIIRGFGNGANNAGIEPSVGVFIDGVYRSRSAAQIGDLANISRVEVLRGPQSTLFGKNASAGIINIVTKAPQYEFGGGAEVSYGNYNAIVARANLTGPIAENVAFAVEGNYNKRDGYMNAVNLGTNPNNRNRWGVRGQLLIEPNDALKFRVIADYDKLDEECCGVVNVINGATGGIIKAIGGNINGDQPFSYDTFQNLDSTNKIKNYGFSGQADLELSDTLSLTSITAYRGVDSLTNQDSDFTSADLLRKNTSDTGIKTFTQELRLASNFDGPINFLLGGYYFDEKIDIANDIEYGAQFRAYGNALIQGASSGALSYATLEGAFGTFEGNAAKYAGQFGAAGQGLDEAFTLKDTAYSIFGTVDFEVTDRLTLTGGFNYTKDKKRFSGNVVSTDVFSGINFDAPAYAGFRQTLLYQGALAKGVGTALGLPGNASAAQITAFATNPTTNPTYNAINAGATSFAATNANVPAANPLNGLKPLQFLPPFLNFPNAVENGKTDDGDLSYSVRLAYEISDNLNAYLSYATGFKASSINTSRDSRPSSADQAALTSAGLLRVNQSYGSRLAGPEDATVYEFGLKGKFDGFGFNLAIFKQALEGFQSNVFRGTGFVLGNAEKQSTKGAEIDATISPAQGLDFTVAYTYLDPLYDKFTGGSAFGPNKTTITTNLTGLVPSGISKHSVSVGGTYKIDAGNGNAIILHSDYLWNSSYQIANGLANEAAPESLNASVAFALENGLELSIWGRNLTEPKYNTAVFPSVAQAGSVSGYPSPPSFYGASVKYKF